MGLLAVTFVARTLPEGQLAVEMYVNSNNDCLGFDDTNRHEIIHDLLGVPAIGFEKQHHDKAKEMKRVVLDYVKRLKEMTGPSGTGTGTGTGTEAAPAAAARGQKWLVTEAGFPKVPADWDLAGLVKTELEIVFRDYLSRHYCEWQLFFNIGTESMWVFLNRPCIKWADHGSTV